MTQDIINPTQDKPLVLHAPVQREQLILLADAMQGITCITVLVHNALQVHTNPQTAQMQQLVPHALRVLIQPQELTHVHHAVQVVLCVQHLQHVIHAAKVIIKMAQLALLYLNPHGIMMQHIPPDSVYLNLT